METGIIPSDLKMAEVTQLFKAGDPGSFTNYRSISILPYFSKILEKLVYKAIHEHLNKYNILYNHQYGFRKNHSTYMALLEFTDRIYTALDSNEYAVSIFLDLSKAFNTVNHNILLSRIYRYGFHGMVHKWLCNCLFNGHESTTNIMQHSVPQGFLLGPLLFIFYINILLGYLNPHSLCFLQMTPAFFSQI